jgi:GMP synthase-like glutamine amidotransferase
MRVLVAQNDPAVPIGTLASPLKDHGIHLTFWPAWAPPPLTLSGYAALIVLGGAANPDQDTQFPGLEHQRRLLREALDRGVPVLGSCLGAQLLAQVLAGQIGPLPHPEIGWVPVQACKAADDDPLYRTLPPLMHAFDWHTYGFSLPPGARLLATSPTAPRRSVSEPAPGACSSTWRPTRASSAAGSPATKTSYVPPASIQEAWHARPLSAPTSTAGRRSPSAAPSPRSSSAPPPTLSPTAALCWDSLPASVLLGRGMR